MKIITKDRVKNVQLWIYPLIMLFMFSVFVGFTIPFLNMIIRLIFLYSVLQSAKYCHRTTGSALLMTYIVYNLLSIIQFSFSGIDFQGYSDDVLNFLLPMFAFYWGANKTRNDYDLFQGLLYSMIFCVVIGLYWYLFDTQWYSLKLIEIHNAENYYGIVSTDGDTTGFMEYARFSSFMRTPYAIQYLGISTLCYMLYIITDYKGEWNKKLIYSSFIIVILGIILCQQRAAWGYMALLLLYYVFVKQSSNKQLKWFVVFVVILIVIGSSYITFTSDRADTIFTQLFERSENMSFSSALKGRSNQYNALLNNWNNYLIGHGMGSGGPVARLSGHPGVTDAGFIKILYENGMLGAILFIALFGTTIARALKNIKKLLFELTVVLFYLMAMTGSNALSISFYYTLPFWFSVGRIWNNYYINRNSI